MKTIQIKPELLHSLNDIQGKPFTVAELTNSYLNRPECLHRGKKPARQFVYRNMQRMIKSGLMEKLPDDGGWPKYLLTKKFQVTKSGQSAKRQTSPPKNSPSNQERSPSDSPEKTLKERLSKHRSDMLCAIGEAEEYETLCKEVPELCDEVQTYYNDARERSSLLLGKIKALESLLTSHNTR